MHFLNVFHKICILLFSIKKSVNYGHHKSNFLVIYFSSNSWMSVTKLTASGGASSHEDEQGQPCLRSNAIALDKVFAPAERSRGTYST